MFLYTYACTNTQVTILVNTCTLSLSPFSVKSIPSSLLATTAVGQWENPEEPCNQSKGFWVLVCVSCRQPGWFKKTRWQLPSQPWLCSQSTQPHLLVLVGEGEPLNGVLYSSPSHVSQPVLELQQLLERGKHKHVCSTCTNTHKRTQGGYPSGRGVQEAVTLPAGSTCVVREAAIPLRALFLAFNPELPTTCIYHWHRRAERMVYEG